MVSQPTSEVGAFDQNGANRNQLDTRSLMIIITGINKFFKCGKEGHPESHFTEGNHKYIKGKK